MNLAVLDFWKFGVFWKIGESGFLAIKGSGNEHWLKELLKGPVQSSNTNTEEVQSGAVYIICFLYILPSYVYLYTQFQKKPRPGKMLNFTKIHRQNYKKLSLSVEILIPPMFCKMRHFGFSFSRPGPLKEATLLFIKVYNSVVVIIC